jgi:hypothetical protein
MQFFYDGQIRRYITQIVRLMSNFSYKDGKGELKTIPVMYGDLTRQVAHIIRDNSENKIPSAPRMAVYITSLEMDRSRTADASYVSKLHVRERAFDENNEEYLNVQGANYTVERLMPTPYTLGINVDIWSTNTDQKLQILEQILMLFNPSLEIQTTDNYVDWTSLTVLDLNGVTFSSRGIPIGTESEIDIATLQFTTPIFISPPTKVKKLGVITKIITSIFNEQTGNIDLGLSMPEMKAYSDETTDTARADINTTADGTVDTSKVVRTDADAVIGTTISDWDIVVLNSIVQIVDKGVVGTTNWRKVLDAYPGIYQAGISRILLERSDMESTVSGTFALNSLNENQIIVNWDADTIPTNTLINGVTNRGTVDYIIDPSTFNPTAIKIAGLRLLILSDIGAVGQVDGADAWKSTGGADLVAQTNDIIEWNGTQWNVLFDASANANSDDSTVTTIYTTNLNTGVQYKWNGATWLLSFEGEYRKGTWNLSL